MDKELIFENLLNKSNKAKVYQLPVKTNSKTSFEDNIETIKWGEESERITAIKNIKNYLISKDFNKPALEVLFQILESDPSDEVRLASVYSLWEIGDRNSFPVLRRTMMNDTNPKVRARAVKTLGYLGDMESIPDFIYFLKLGRQIHALIRSAVINAFGSIFHTPALKHIIDATNDADINIRREASRALGTYVENPATQPSAIKTLEKILNWNKETDSSVRCFAIHSLRQSTCQKANELVANSATKDPNDSVRGEAIASLYMWQTALSIKTICMAFSEINWQNRKKAIFTLKRLLNNASGNNVIEVSDALLRGIRLFPSNSREYGFTKSLLKRNEKI